MPTSRASDIRKAIHDLDVAGGAIVKAWWGHLLADLRENFFNDDEREKAKKFSPGYVVLRSFAVGALILMFLLGFFFLAAAVGTRMWSVILRNQVDWFHTDSQLVAPLILDAYALILILWVGPSLQVSFLGKIPDREKFALRNEARKTLAQICGGAILLTGLYASFRTLDVSREGQLNDLYTKSVEQIGATEVNGKPKTEIRVGGIYSLGRIARSSDSLKAPVYNVLASYIRSHVPFSQTVVRPQSVSFDVQAAINVLQTQPVPDWPLWDLDLRGYNLENGVFQGVDLSSADLREVDLIGADLREAKVSSADFRGTYLRNAHFEGVDLRRTNITQEQVDTVFGDDKTLLRSDLKRPSRWHAEPKTLEQQWTPVTPK